MYLTVVSLKGGTEVINSSLRGPASRQEPSKTDPTLSMQLVHVTVAPEPVIVWGSVFPHTIVPRTTDFNPTSR